MEEIWKPVKGFEGKYEVSALGRVRSLKNNKGNRREIPKILAFGTSSGYPTVDLCKDGKVMKSFVHRIVAEAFIENPLNLPQVNHKDEVKTNNFVFLDESGTVVPEKSNLEWCDCKHNINWGTRTERMARSQSKRTLQYDLEGNLIREWPSVMEIERQTGWRQGNISECCRGKYRTMYGFVWRYAE